MTGLTSEDVHKAVDLAAIGDKLDADEKKHMAEAGTLTREYQQFAQQPSGNYDDSGFFSIQVIEKAIATFGLQLQPFTANSPEAIKAREDPTSQQAFICNFRSHWLCIRKLGMYWFNLNSLLTGPELLSDTMLDLLLKQLQQEGHSIYTVLGEMPACKADDVLSVTVVTQEVKPQLMQDYNDEEQGSSSVITNDDMKRAMAQSKQLHEDDDESLQRALAMSIEESGTQWQLTGDQPSTSKLQTSAAQTGLTGENSATAAVPTPCPEQIRQDRAGFLSRFEQNKTTQQTEGSGLTEEEQLEKAIQMSMDSSSSNAPSS